MIFHTTNYQNSVDSVLVKSPIADARLCLEEALWLLSQSLARTPLECTRLVARKSRFRNHATLDGAFGETTP